jgi:hypothetical protein
VTPQGVIVSSSLAGGTVTSVTAGTGLSGGTINTTGTINLVPATNASLGGIIVGANLTVDANGVLSASPPGSGSISGVIAGLGLQGGGLSGVVTLNMLPASTTQLGGVSIVSGGGLSVTSGSLSLAAASTSQTGGVRLATNAEVITGVDNTKAVTPAGIAAKVASTLVPGIVQLSDSLASPDSTKAATQTAAFTANAAAVSAQATANAALPKAGGVMTGIITFASGQTFPGVALPKATTSSLGVVQVGSGLSINSSGVLSTANVGTVTAVTAGPGLGSPATGNIISTSGTIRLLPPTGTSLGGVKTGTSNPNVSIAFDGTITVGGFLSTNNPYAFDGYIWPVPDTFGFTPGSDGQVLTIADKTTGTLAWTNTGTLSTVTAGTGISVVSTATTATVSLANVASITAGAVGATGLIPTLTVNSSGQITSFGQANPFSPFQIPTVTAPFNLVLDFQDNNTNWDFTLQGNTTLMNPSNAVSGQTGTILIRQDPGIPYVLTFGSAWKFAGGTPPAITPVAAAVDMLQFVVVDASYIVVTSFLADVG